MTPARERSPTDLTELFLELGKAAGGSDELTRARYSPTGREGLPGSAEPLSPKDLEADGIEERFLELAERRMEAAGELCPFELLPSDDCRKALEVLLAKVGIVNRGNVAVYSTVD